MSRHFDAVFENGVLRPLEPLALPERQHVRLTLEEQPNGETSANGRARPKEPMNDPSEEMLWLAQESSSYAGEWVAIHGPRLIAHGAKLADVSAAAKAAGVYDPLFASVPENPDVPFAGW